MATLLATFREVPADKFADGKSHRPTARLVPWIIAEKIQEAGNDPKKIGLLVATLCAEIARAEERHVVVKDGRNRPFHGDGLGKVGCMNAANFFQVFQRGYLLSHEAQLKEAFFTQYPLKDASTTPSRKSSKDVDDSLLG